MDFKKVFRDIDVLAETKAKADIKKIIKGDGKFLKMKKLAKKSADAVPDFLTYVYTIYHKQINALSTKYGIDYDALAQLFMTL